MYKKNRKNKVKKHKKNNSESISKNSIRSFCNKNQSIASMISAIVTVIGVIISSIGYVDKISLKNIEVEDVYKLSNEPYVEQLQISEDRKKTPYKLKAEEVPRVNEINIFNEFTININPK